MAITPQQIQEEMQRFPGLTSTAAEGNLIMREQQNLAQQQSDIQPNQALATDTAGNVYDRFSNTLLGQVNLNTTNPFGAEQPTTSPVISSQGAQIKLDQNTQDVNTFMANSQAEADKSAKEQQDLMKKQEDYLNNLLAQQTEQFKATTEQAVGERQKLGERALKGFGAQAALSGGQFASSTLLDLNAIDMETQTAVQDLRSKRDQAIATAQQAIAEKKVGLAESAFKDARQIQKDMLGRQKEGIAMRGQLVTQARADQTAQQTEANRVRDDARASIQQALATFGGAGIENMPPETRAFLDEQAKLAGFGPGYLEGSFRTLKEQATAKQQELAEAKLKDKQQQDLFMNTIRTSQLAISALHASIAQAKAEGALQPGMLSGKFSTDYLMSRSGDYLDPNTGAVNWLALDALENTDKNLWHDMTVTLEKAQEMQAKAVGEMGTAPEDKASVLDKSRVGSFIKPLLNPTPEQVSGATSAATTGVKEAISNVSPLGTAWVAGLDWLFGDTTK